MRELETIQKQEKLNKVYAVDKPGPGGANHFYRIASEESLHIESGPDS